jgi:Magnesium chelatase, subunit ChlI
MSRAGCLQSRDAAGVRGDAHGEGMPDHCRPIDRRHGRADLRRLDSPGAGKSMLAHRLTTILPDMTLAEAIETTRMHRVTGFTGDRTIVVIASPPSV